MCPEGTPLPNPLEPKGSWETMWSKAFPCPSFYRWENQDTVRALMKTFMSLDIAQYIPLGTTGNLSLSPSLTHTPREREGSLVSLPLLPRTLIPSWGRILLSPSKPNHLPKAPLPKPSHRCSGLTCKMCPEYGASQNPGPQGTQSVADTHFCLRLLHWLGPECWRSLDACPRGSELLSLSSACLRAGLCVSATPPFHPRCPAWGLYCGL